jgi:hypothetical protein
MYGWNRLWKRETQIARTTEGALVNLSLRTADAAHLLSGPDTN